VNLITPKERIPSHPWAKLAGQDKIHTLSKAEKGLITKLYKEPHKSGRKREKGLVEKLQWV
jgi:hypothetical protein